MIEVFRKGFRLDIDPATIVTFKKSQNLNGVQARYAYSNTISIDRTANNKKLLELFDLPTGKINTMMNGFEVDVVLNGSLQLRKQTLKITKETTSKIEIYFLWSDAAVFTFLKSTYVNALVDDMKYKYTIADFNALKNGTTYLTAFTETQPKSGLFVIEEMPVLINVQEIVRRMFTSNNYSVYGDFFSDTATFKDYYCAPNKGEYHIYPGSGDGFAPSFDTALDAYTFLNQCLSFFNCYATTDDTYKTVVINSWVNIGNFKTNYVDYSKHFIDYQDYTFRSKLAKRNELIYADSGTAFNSFFINNLSSEVKSTYLASAFGAGTLNIFDDSTIDDNGTIEVRPDGEEGETSAVRIFKIADTESTLIVYENGSRIISTFPVVRKTITARKAIAVSMADVYDEFHKGYTDFILTPLLGVIKLRYDDIVAAEFSLTKVFFLEQLASYWIPLEINFSTKKDQISVKGMLVKKRKVESPILNNFNSVLLDFKEKAVFPLEYLLSMYPMPPNASPWETVVFRSYDQNKNRLYINDVLIPAVALPQSFLLSGITSIKIEANKPSDTLPDTNTAPINLQAIAENGGASNEAYINVKHTGIASYESNFAQVARYLYEKTLYGPFVIKVKPFEYYVGAKPNLNDTVTTPGQVTDSIMTDAFAQVIATQVYDEPIKVVVSAHQLKLSSYRLADFPGRVIARLYIYYGAQPLLLKEYSVSGTNAVNIDVPRTNVSFDPDLPIGGRIRVFWTFNIGLGGARIEINNMSVDISTVAAI